MCYSCLLCAPSPSPPPPSWELCRLVQAAARLERELTRQQLVAGSARLGTSSLQRVGVSMQEVWGQGGDQGRGAWVVECVYMQDMGGQENPISGCEKRSGHVEQVTTFRFYVSG